MLREGRFTQSADPHAPVADLAVRKREHPITNCLRAQSQRLFGRITCDRNASNQEDVALVSLVMTFPAVVQAGRLPRLPENHPYADATSLIRVRP